MSSPFMSLVKNHSFLCFCNGMDQFRLLPVFLSLRVWCVLGAQVRSKAKVPTKSVFTEHLELRKEVLALFNLQKQVRSLCVLLAGYLSTRHGTL